MALSGTLQDFLLEDIFQLIGLGNYNGCLRIIKPNGVTGEIYFNKGTVIHASAGSNEAEQAVYNMFNWRQGDFLFEKECVPGKESMRINWQGVILEAARLSDEAAKRPEKTVTPSEPPPAEAPPVSGEKLEITETVVSGVNKEDAAVETPATGFSLNKTAKHEDKTKQEHKAPLGSGILGLDKQTGEVDIGDKLKGFDLDIGKTSSSDENISHLEFLFISYHKLLDYLNSKIPKRFSYISDALGETTSRLRQSGEITEELIFNPSSLTVSSGGRIGDEKKAFTDMLKIIAGTLQCLNDYAKKNAQISFLNYYYEEVSGQARIMSQHLGFPLLSIKYLIDSHCEALITDDSLTI